MEALHGQPGARAEPLGEDRDTAMGTLLIMQGAGAVGTLLAVP